MKTASALVLFCLVVSSWAQTEEDKNAINKCLEKVGLTPDDLKTDPDSKKHSTKCFNSCMVQNYIPLDDQGKFSAEKIEQSAAMVEDEALRKELIDKTMRCKETVEASGVTDQCEVGSAFFACTKKAFMSIAGAKS